jgi:hypothetical protein
MLLRLAILALLAVPQAPDATLPPASAQVRYKLIGHGVQIYHCAASSDAQTATFQWTLDGPEAALFDPLKREQVGTHTAGPTWTWNDGSAITGKVLQKQPSPDPTAIPWLLLETHAANTTTGALTGITFVRRSDTQAGAAPTTGCNPARGDNTLRVPYEAAYTFYSTN